MRIYIGIDPGKSGAIAALYDDIYPCLCKLSQTDTDVYDWLRGHDLSIATAVIERVHSMPKQGVASSFKFGTSYGFLIGVLTACKIPYRMVTPQVWQKAMGCLSRGDKNTTKAAAQRLWPQVKVTHATADALLIAEYCRRTWM